MDFKKPRVSISYFVVPQTNYRNDGACLFVNYNLHKLLDGRDAWNDHAIMREDTGNVVYFDPSGPRQQWGTFDLNILIDHGEDGLGVPLDWEIPRPNCYWIADSHLGYDYRLKRAKQFDHVFASHKPSIEKLIKDGIPAERIHYMPWAAEPMCYKPFPIMEKWDWCFIGYLNNDFRIDLVDRFCKEWPVGEKGYLGWRIPEIRGYNVLEDVAKKFSQSRIVLNESVKDDLNMRVMEGLACRRLVLTEDVPAIHDHFKEGTHLITFKTVDEAIEKAKFLLKDDAYRNEVAKEGYMEFLSKHTYMHRTKEILKTCLHYEVEEIKGEPVHV